IRLLQTQFAAQAIRGVAVGYGVVVPRAIFTEQRAEIRVAETRRADGIDHVCQPIVRIISHDDRRTRSINNIRQIASRIVTILRASLARAPAVSEPVVGTAPPLAEWQDKAAATAISAANE